MKKNLIRVFCLVLILTLAVGVLPAMAADEITVYVSVSAQGVPAQTKDGAPASLLAVKVPAGSTVEAAVIAAHAKYCPAGAEGFQMAESDWGLSMVLIWGSADGVGGYYVNGVMPMDNVRNVTANNGDVIELVLYREDWSDSYARFNTWYAEVTPGVPLTLSLTHEAFDENWNPAPEALTGAKVKTLDGKELGVTDAEGKITLFFDAPGSCIVTAETADLAITAPCCYVSVTGAAGLISPAPQAKTYVVKPGDTLWKIAKNALGSGFRWGELFALNADQVKNPRMIYVGQVLRLPA